MTARYAFKTKEQLEREMAQFDQLGPKTREALRLCPLDTDVETLIRAFRSHSPYRDIFNPTPPKPEDERLAEFITEALKQKLPGYKPLRNPMTASPLSRKVFAKRR